MERKLGEIFECNGVKLRVKEDIDECIGCFFYENNIGCSRYNGDIGDCDRIGRTDSNSVVFEEVKDMEERTIKLTLEKAKEFYKKGGEFKDLALSAFSEEELKEIHLPKTWEEFCDSNSITKCEYYIGTNSFIYERIQKDRHEDIDRNVLPSLKSAEAHRALMQLHQLRDCYRQGWKPDWRNTNLCKYSIVFNSNTPEIVPSFACNCFLSFQSEETAKEFLNNFTDLILKAGDLV